MQEVWISSITYCRNSFSQNKNSSEKMVLDDLPNESAEEWNFNAVFTEDA